MAQAKRKAKTKTRQRWLLFVISFLVFLVLTVIGGYFALLYAGEQLIDEKKLEDMKLPATVIYDKNGDKVTDLYVRGKREYVKYNEIPKHVVDAFVAVEDKRFFEHNGVDPIRIVGAIWKDIRAGGKVEGASTITQQLARNVFLTLDKSFWRKTKEVSIAINLEQKYTKEQILEMYLNNIYFGHGAMGIQMASKLYFDKDVKDLTVAQAAMLAAIPKAPSYYSPFADPAKAKERRDTVLRLMAEQGYITPEQKIQAQNEPLPKRKNVEEAGMKKGYQAFVDYVVREAEQKYGFTEEMLYRGGWKIYTTLDPNMQDAMVDVYSNDSLFPKGGPDRQVESGMVVVSPQDGGIAAMMGGRNYVPKGFNYAVDTRRQPGSTFKPLAVYGPALDSGQWDIWSSLSNKKQSFNGYVPENYNNQYSDHISMYKALVKSLNVPAVWLLNEIGVEKGISYVEKFGIDLAPEDRNLAIALGGLNKGVSPLQMAQAYTAFANGGVVSKAHAIVKIVDEHDNAVVTAEPDQTRVLSAQAAWSVHRMLVGVVQEGTGTAAKRAGRPVAGKTGTTESEYARKANKDAWFVGYTPEYVGAIWMGFDPEDRNHVMRSGSEVPARLFGEVMRRGLAGVRVHNFQRPEGVKDPQIMELSAPVLKAVLAMENQQPKVVLSWTGNEQMEATYDVYRFTDSPDNKQLVASGLRDRTYVDTLNEPVLYKYLVIPRDQDGNEGPPSNVAEVDISQLDQFLKDSQQHDDRGQNGQAPDQGGTDGTDNGSGDQGNGGQTGNGQDGTGQGGTGQGGTGQGGTGQGDGSTPPPDIPNDGGTVLPGDGGGQTTPDQGTLPPGGTETPRKHGKKG